MIKFQLETPILLKSQWEAVQKASHYDSESLAELGFADTAVLTEDGVAGRKGDLISLDNSKPMPKEALTGIEAILWLAQECGCPQEPLTEINIPLKVYNECSGDQWAGISVLSVRVLRRNNRYAKLKALSAPDKILHCEAMMLTQEAWYLEDNNRGDDTKRWNDGLAIRSLNDIGYSLITGWDEDKKEDFARRQREFEEEIEKDQKRAMAEAEKEEEEKS